MGQPQANGRLTESSGWLLYMYGKASIRRNRYMHRKVHAPAGIPTAKGSYRFTVRHCAGMDVIHSTGTMVYVEILTLEEKQKCFTCKKRSFSHTSITTIAVHVLLQTTKPKHCASQNFIFLRLVVNVTGYSHVEHTVDAFDWTFDSICK